MGPCVFSLYYFFESTTIFTANEKHTVLKCTCDPSFRRSCWNNMACRERSIDVSKYIQFFRLSCNIQTLFYWGRKGELYTSYHIWLISWYKDLKTKVALWFSLVIGQTTSRQLGTSSENLVASAQFLVALVTSELQFRALQCVTSLQTRLHLSNSKQSLT